LTEDRRLDCRKQIANLAGVSTGNVTKVKQIPDSAGALQLIEALCPGEISIHRAWTLSKLSTREQEADFGNRRSKKRRGERLRKLLARHVPKSDPAYAQLHCLDRCLTGLKNLPGMASIGKQIDGLITALEHEFTAGRSRGDEHQTDYKEDTRRQSELMGQSADKPCDPRELPEGARLPNHCAGS
jgi:hypothetical protein